MDTGWLAVIGALFLLAGVAALAYDASRRRRGRDPYPFPDIPTSRLPEEDVPLPATRQPPAETPHPRTSRPSRRISRPRLPKLALRVPGRRAHPAFLSTGAIAVIVATLFLITLAAGAATLLLSRNAGSIAHDPGTTLVVVCPFDAAEGHADPSALLAQDLRQQAAQVDARTQFAICDARVTGPDSAEAERAALGADLLVWGSVAASGDITAALALPVGYSPGAEPWVRWSDRDPTELQVPQTLVFHMPAGSSAAPLGPLVMSLAWLRAGNYRQARSAATGAVDTLEQAGADAAPAKWVEGVALLCLGNDSDALGTLGSAGGDEPPPEVLIDRARADIGLSSFSDAQAALDRALAQRVISDRAALIAHVLRARAMRLSGDASDAVTEADAALQVAPDASARYEKAQALYSLSQPDLAQSELNSLLRAEPRAAAAYNLAALVALMLGKPDSALTSLKTAGDIYSDWQSGLRAEEASAQLSGDSQAAKDATQEIIALDHELSSVHLYRGMAFADQARREPQESFFGGLWRKLRGQPTTYERATAELQEAQRLDGHRLDVLLELGTVYRAAGDNTQAAATFKQAVSLAPTRTEPYLALADLQTAQGDTREAAATLNSLIGQAPGAFEAYEQLYEIYTRTGDTASARSTLQAAVAQPANSAAAHLWKGKFYTLLGSSAEAIAEFQAATTDPALWEAHVLLGKAYEANGNATDALTQFNAALRAQPNDPSALLEAGKLYVVAGQPDKANELFSRLTTVVPDSAEGHIAYSQLLIGKGDVTKAVQEGKRAVQADSKRADTHAALARAYEAGADWASAAAEYKVATQRDPNDFESFLRMGIDLFRDDRYTESIAASDTASRLRPDDPQTYRWAAEALVARRDADAALSRLGQALKVAPDMPEALALTARAYALKGDLASAENYAHQSVDAGQQNPTGHLALGGVLLDENSPQAALAEFSTAAGLAPQPAEALVGQGRCYAALGDTAKALATFKSALENDPKYAPAHLYAGHTLAAASHWDEALAEYSQAVALRPRWPEALYYQGRAFVQQKDLSRAAAAFSKATEQSPALVDAWYGLGIADRGLSKQKEAIEALTTVTNLNPGYAEAWLYLGLTYEETGDRVSARKAFSSAANITGDDSVRLQAEQGLERVK